MVRGRDFQQMMLNSLPRKGEIGVEPILTDNPYLFGPSNFKSFARSVKSFISLSDRCSNLSKENLFNFFVDLAAASSNLFFLPLSCECFKTYISP